MNMPKDPEKNNEQKRPKGCSYILFVIILIVAGGFGWWYSPNRNALRKAVKTKDVGKIEQLLKEGVDPDLIIKWEKPFPPQTALHIACDSGSLEVVKTLLKGGAKGINHSNYPEPITFAAGTIRKENGTEIVKLLLKNGANPNSYGALFWASRAGNLETVRVLLKAGANPNASFKGSSCVYIADSSNRLEIVDLLIEYGARAPRQPIHWKPNKAWKSEKDKVKK